MTPRGSAVPVATIRTSHRAVARVAAFVLAALGCAAQGVVGAGRAVVPPDPYTQNEPALLRQAGYVSFGPFVFGAGHTTAEVDELLGSEPVIWIESAHFRLGCAVAAVSTKGDTEWSRRLKGELKRLAAKLPRVRPDTGDLDPWLRAHLFAQRLEELYADVLENLGATDATFAANGWGAADASRLLGLGPYLGMPEKYTVLLLHGAGSHARYTRAFQRAENAKPVRRHDREFGCLYWGASEETADWFFANDEVLHAHLTFHVAHNLYTGYRGCELEAPQWLAIGLAHWHARRVSPRYPAYGLDTGEDRDPRGLFWEWDERVPGLLRHGALEPFARLMERTAATPFGLEQHMHAWSLVAFLMAKHRAATMRFLHACKEPVFQRWRTQTQEQLRARQVDALQQQLGFTPQELEAAWRRAVLGPKTR
jgi:hypothetical protein